MAKPASVLVIDQDVTTLEALRVGLSNDGLRIEAHADPREALRAFAVARFDAVIAEVGVPRVGGLSVLARVRQYDPSVPVILLSGPASVQRAAEAVKDGAFDYVVKPFRVAKVRAVVERALEIRRLLAEVERLRAEVGGGGRCDELIAQSPAMAPVVDAVRRAAASDCAVLIVGGPGTGRELVARTIHRMGRRAAGPFVVGDCALLGEGLVESELFGHVRGAFPGAVAARPGLVETADGGTLLLEAIGELSKAAQRRLLTVLDMGELRPLGGTSARAVDVRLVAATTADLAAAVEARRFRSDLHGRIAAIRIALPELGERRDDIPLLAQYFVKRMCARVGIEAPTISSEAMAQLLAGSWPGNVRQLRETLERATLLADRGVIRPEHFVNPAAAADDVVGGHVGRSRLAAGP